MDKLKNFIEQNRASFEQTELPDGHFAHFMKRLESANLSNANSTLHKKKNKFSLYTTWLVAASIAIAIFLTYFSEQPKEKTYSCKLGNELSNIRTYYLMQMDDLMIQMEEANNKLDNPAIPALIEAGKKIQKECELFDIQVAPTLPCSDLGLYAINQQYANSFTSMQILYDQLKNSLE